MTELQEKLKSLGFEDKDSGNLSEALKFVIEKSATEADSKIKKELETAQKAITDKLAEVEKFAKETADKVATQKSEQVPVTLKGIAAKTIAEKSEAFKTFGSSKLGGHFGLVDKAATEMLDVTALGVKSKKFTGEEKAPEFATPVFDLFSKGNISEYRVEWVDRNGVQGATAIVARGAVKPLLSFDWTDRTAKYVTLAGIVKMSNQLKNDVPTIIRTATEIVNYDLARKKEYEILFGVDPDCLGITGKAAAYTATAMDLKVKLPNRADALRAAMLQIATLGYTPNVAVLNSGDVALLDIQKDENGNYISFQINNVLRQLRIVESIDIPAGSLLVADTTKWNVYTHGGIAVDLFDQNEDDAKKNKFMLRVEQDIYCYVSALHTSSAVYDTFTNVITAITKP